MKYDNFPPLATLATIFFDRTKCEEFLLSRSVFYDVINCPGCGKETIRNDRRNFFRCSNYKCRRETSMRVYTFFYGSQLNCGQIMHLAYMWLNHCGQHQMINQTGNSEHTVTDFMNHFRNLVCSTLDEEDYIIGGDGIIVEVDETKLGKRKYNRGHRVEGVWVLVGVERTEAKKAFVIEIPDRKAETLIPLIARYVHPGSIIHTDMFKSYLAINSVTGMTHRTVNHTKWYKDPITGVHTNTVEGNNNALKIMIKPRNRVQGIGNFLGEFVWRRKNKNDIWEAFLYALKIIHYEL